MAMFNSVFACVFSCSHDRRFLLQLVASVKPVEICLDRLERMKRMSASRYTNVHHVFQKTSEFCVYYPETVFVRVLQDVLMNLAKAVANAAAMMVLKAKNVAQFSEDNVLQNRVIAAATQCALSTSQLVACAKVEFTYLLIQID